MPSRPNCSGMRRSSQPFMTQNTTSSGRTGRTSRRPVNPCRTWRAKNATPSGDSPRDAEAALTPQTQDHWPESRGYWLSRAAPVTDDAGNTIGAMETATDIRALKQAEMERERFRAAINQAEDMIMITDREGTIEYVNPAFERITGYTAAEAIGENPRILKSGVQDDAFYRDFWETICSGNTCLLYTSD